MGRCRIEALLSRDSRAAQRIEVPDHVGDSCFGCPSVGQPAESCLERLGAVSEPHTPRQTRRRLAEKLLPCPLVGSHKRIKLTSDSHASLWPLGGLGATTPIP